MRWYKVGTAKNIDKAIDLMSKTIMRDIRKAPECDIKGGKKGVIEFYYNQRLIGKYEGVTVSVYAA